MKNKKFSILRVIIALLIIFAILATITLGYFIYSRTFGENEYCQSLRKQKDISIDYSCTLGNEFVKDGKSYIYIGVERPNKNFIDFTQYTMEKDNKKITGVMSAD